MALTKYDGGADSGWEGQVTVNLSRSITVENPVDLRKEATKNIVEIDLPLYKQKDAKRWCEEAMDKFDDDDFKVAKYICEKFGSEYEGYWVCVIGNCAISFFTMENTYFNFTMAGKKITIYRARK